MSIHVDEWQGCYPSQWKGLVVPDAMSHPAKFSSKLIRRIYQHMIAEGWVKPGDAVVDPFGGIALGALDAMRLGLDWIGVELEPRFHDLGNQNIQQWQARFSAMPHWGTARLLNGDSRRLLEVISQANAAVSSPPYADSLNSDSNGIDWSKSAKDYLGRVNHPARQVYLAEKHSWYHYGAIPGQLGGMKPGDFEAAISSPPFGSSEGRMSSDKFKDPEKLAEEMAQKYQDGTFKGHAASKEAILRGLQKANSHTYGDTPGQMGTMKPGDFEAAISSPPFRQSSGGQGAGKGEGPIGPALKARHAAGNGSSGAYGQTDGQLANLPEGDFEAAISSPPYNEARIGQESGQGQCGRGDQYGATPGQIGGADDFWMAARQIVEQVYLALPAGGHAVWVCKDYVKNKEIVPFASQWMQLCEAVGFRTVHEHHAMLVRRQGASRTLDGKTVEHVKEHKSFFKRLMEKKGAPPVDYETILCMEKP